MLRRSLPFLFRRVNRSPPCVCNVGLVRFGSFRGTDAGLDQHLTQSQKRGKGEIRSPKATPTESTDTDTPTSAPSSGGKAKLSVEEEVKRKFSEVKRMLEGVTVDFSGGISEMDCKDDPEEGSNCLYVNTDANGHHSAKFRATRGGNSIVVCVRMCHGISSTGEEIKKPPTSKVLQNESGVSEADLVDLLLVIESNPRGPNQEVTFGRKSKFNNRAIRIDGSYFIPASVLT